MTTIPAPALSATGTGSPVPDRIESVTLFSVRVPLAAAVEDAKVRTGRQRALTEVAVLVAEIRTEDGLEGTGFGYCLRAGAAAQFAHAREVAPDLVGEDPNDIARLWTKLAWSPRTS
jgi:L-alanine-DL-glutamate epimerase-like enolase superfamily enzyme